MILDREAIEGWVELLDLIKAAAKPREPVRLAGGGETSVYLDIKGVLDTGSKIELAADVMTEWMYDLSLNPTAIGGPTMGADVLSHGVAFNCSTFWDMDLKWFSVRDKAKTDHGLGRWIEGAQIGPGDRVIMTDDVVSTGNSMVKAFNHVICSGAEIIAVMPLVDRTGLASTRFRGIPYLPLITFEHLGIEPLQQADSA